MKKTVHLEKIVNDNHGILSSSQKNDVPKQVFYDYLAVNHFDRIAHGIYASKDAWVDDLYILHLQYPEAVFSHEEALLLHGFTDREPLQHVMTVKTGYNPWRMKEKGIKVYSIKKELLSVGRITIKDAFGNRIPVYDKERTICDIIRSRKTIETQEFFSAIKNYALCDDKNLVKLMKYARIFHVEKLLRQYLEVLL